MAYSSGKLSTESQVSRKKQEIVAKSMAIIDRHVDQWIEKSIKRVPKRTRDDHDSGVEDHGAGGSSITKAGGEGAVRSIKKRAKREPKAEDDGLRFACPFYVHNPDKYKRVPTCCGPGWTDVHRVKEHIYRRHSLKDICPRCFEQFKSNEDLKQHQRSEEPCKLQKKVLDEMITDEQDKLLHARAKPKCSEEKKWQEMYLIIFPDTKKVPLPYYESIVSAKQTAAADEKPAAVKATSASTPKKMEESLQFKDDADVKGYKEHIQRGIHRMLRPYIEREVEKMFRSMQNAMTLKVTELSHDVTSRLSRTLKSGFSSRASSPSSSSSSPSSPSSSTTPSSSSSEPPLNGDRGDCNQLLPFDGPIELNFEEMLAESAITEGFLGPDGLFDFDAYLYETSGGCDVSFGVTTNSDSGYHTSSDGDRGRASDWQYNSL
ncbi:hypothetical protein B0H66DRAFT_346136 [Apodospora peruviana]|uniref:C2H2-type domain-containing protein n=1 Tax=Apodospora peruviana TaxID=516989 RepID=A0AAE0HZ49_9PEZI|nr:hypothetical protein B0H66DRAFT_346136 [Apodospora peruviana]